MSIHWIRNILADDEPTSLDIQFGKTVISDKCYAKVEGLRGRWFNPTACDRETILREGIEILKEYLEDKELKITNGKEFKWE